MRHEKEARLVVDVVSHLHLSRGRQVQAMEAGNRGRGASNHDTRTLARGPSSTRQQDGNQHATSPAPKVGVSEVGVCTRVICCHHCLKPDCATVSSSECATSSRRH